MAAWLKPRLSTHAKIYCSPAERCQQTALALSDAFTTLPETAPGATYRTLLKAIGWPHEAGMVVLVNHQPTLGELASYLLCGEPHGWRVKKGSLWWLDIRRGTTHLHVSLRASLSPDLL